MPNSTSMLVLSEEHFTTLEGYLDEYKSAKKKERKALTDIIATELGGTIPSIAPLNLANFRKQIHEWFVDRLRKKKKPLVKYSAKWTAKMVFTREYSEEVEKRNIEASKAPPGKPDYLATLQTTVKRLWNEQTPEEQERMKQLAEQYNEAGMPRELQLRHAEKYAGQVCSEFAHYMYRHFGARVWILGAMMDEEDDVAVEWHDYNAEIGNIQPFTDFAPEWKDKPVLPLFKDYAQAIFGKTGEGIPVKGKKKARSDIRLDVDEDNLPLLPEETPTSRVDVDAVVRQFITGHYRYICQNQKATVPWNVLSSNPEAFMPSEYIPSGVNMKDPSRLTVAEGQSLIALWRQREVEGNAPLDFSGYRAKDGTMQVPKRFVTELFSQHGGPGRKRTAANSEQNVPKKGSKNGGAGDVNEGLDRPKLKGRAKDKGKQKASTQKKRRRGKAQSEDEATSTDGHESSDGDSTTESDSDDDNDVEEDFTDKLKEVGSDDEDDEVSKLIKDDSTERLASSKPPAGVDPGNPEARLTFLNDLCDYKEYRTMVEAIFTIEKKVGSPPKAFPPFGRWSYDLGRLPDTVHSDEAKAKKWLGWLRSRPFETPSGQMAAYGIFEGVALAIGMFLKDLHTLQFSTGDPDEVSSIDPVMLTSRMKFEWTDGILLPVCNDVVQCILDARSQLAAKEDAVRRRSPTKVGGKGRGGGTPGGGTPGGKKRRNKDSEGLAAEESTPKKSKKPTTPFVDDAESASGTQVRVQPKRAKKNQTWHKNADLL